MNKTLSVSAIKNGTVIDHIPVGQALKIIRLLNVSENKHQVTLGLNLPSKSMGKKDLLKIENRVLNDNEAHEIALFAPAASINIIKNFEIVKKLKAEFPENIHKILICPNENCITHAEKIDSCFQVKQYQQKVRITCKYCERVFDRDQIKDYAL